MPPLREITASYPAATGPGPGANAAQDLKFHPGTQPYGPRPKPGRRPGRPRRERVPERPLATSARPPHSAAPHQGGAVPKEDPMRKRTWPRGLPAAAGIVMAAALALLALPSAPSAQAAESLTVNLASVTGPATGVGEGFLYGVSQDGTQPADQYLAPLGVNAFRGGGHVSGGTIGRES